jgi:NAD dependent epimerase/dehydratase family
VSKLAGEQYLLACQQSFGLETLAFRFFNVYGPRQMPGHAYAAVVPVFLAAMLRGRPVPVHGDGLRSRDFTYVGTVWAVLLDAVTRLVAHPEPMAVRASEAGLDVVGLDTDQRVVDGLNAGHSHIDDVSDTVLGEALVRGFRATTEPACIADADVVVVCVPTPLSETAVPTSARLSRRPA